jgi:hypothetical protein
VLLRREEEYIMGLDMYLVGRKSPCYTKEEKETQDGYPVSSTELRLGYWRKHPNLHGYIINEFAKGEDNCQQIFLSRDDLLKIIQAVKDDNLPHTEGFFFGASATKEDDYYLEEKNEDIKIFAKAIDWMDMWSPGHGYRDVYYHASW